MLVLASRTQLMITIVLASLIAATRGHHFDLLNHLPSASWAAFFLAGVYVRSLWVFPGLLAEAAALDYVAITWGGVSSFCVSPAYGFLLPAYGALGVAGRWYATRHHESLATLVPLTISMLIGVSLCELLSSGSFYYLSGRFDETSLAGLSERMIQFFPRALFAFLFYVGAAGVLHVAFRAAGSVAATVNRLRTSG
mgnify:FL=1